MRFFMRRKTRAKVKKALLISGIIVGIVIIMAAIILIVILHNREISYDDGLVGKNYFTEITIDFNTKEVKRDGIDTSLREEFDISEEQETLSFSSEEEMRNLLSNSVFEISTEGQVITIKNPYQTKKIIVEADEIKEQVPDQEITEITEGLYVLSFYSEKLTKAMYNYYKEQDYIQQVFLDEVFIDEPLNDISQTMYGEVQVDLNNHHSLGVTQMGLDNYASIIQENGNPADIVIATIGYGVDYENEFFHERIQEDYYNFILNNQNISQTIEQGSRIAEVLVDSTTENVKIMPLVTVTEEGYTSIASIIQAIAYGIEHSDVICYELVNHQHEAIDKILESAFRENVPVCCVTSHSEENYPANHGMTIATSSIGRDLNTTDYSGTGDYIDFVAPSTDVEEIFKASSTVSRWSGPGYSNAQMVATIALIKTYDKNATILDIYNFIRNFCIDLGEEGKDELYGYGYPNFQNLTIADIDKQAPTMKEITYENETWEVLKQIKIEAEDNIRMNAWAITKNENGPNDNEWQILQSVTPDLDVTTEITENGIYYIWIRDIAGNTASQTIEINKIDTTPPQIAYTINQDTLASGYVTINVTAEDTESGLNDGPFSWDQNTWSLENSTRSVKENGRYKIYVRDSLGNTGEQEILVDCFPQEGIYELGPGNIITTMNVSANWNGNTNNNVQITLNQELDIAGWQITTSAYEPQNFVEVESNSTGGATNNNQNTNSNTVNVTINTSLPNNVVWGNTTNTESSENNTNVTNSTDSQNTQTTNENTIQTQRIEPRTEPIVLNLSLNIDTTYYFWIKDSVGNTDYQTFTIAKAPIE